MFVSCIKYTDIIIIKNKKLENGNMNNNIIIMKHCQNRLKRFTTNIKNIIWIKMVRYLLKMYIFVVFFVYFNRFLSSLTERVICVFLSDFLVVFQSGLNYVLK